MIYRLMKNTSRYLILAFVFAIASCSFTTKKFEGNDKEKVLLQLITYVLQEGHFSPKDINDEFSSNIYEEYLNRIDPFKRYFYESDLEDFEKYRTELDDQIKDLNLDFFNYTFERYLERLSEAEGFYKDIVEKPFDYNLKEEYQSDYEKLEFVDSKKEMKDRWRKQLKFSTISNYHEVLEAKKDTVFVKENIEIETRESTSKTMQESFEYLKERDRDDFFSIYLNTIVEEFDPHTFYYAPEDKDRFDLQMSGSFEGIGAKLQKKAEGIMISELISGGPAWRQGKLEVGDQIVKVRQEEEKEPTSIVGMRLEDAIKLIKGPKDTYVILTVKKISGELKDVSIKRGVVELEETFVKSSTVDYNGANYGLINLPKFYIEFKDSRQRNAATDIKKELVRLKEKGVEGVILDLRNNGGGSLQTVVDIVGYFIKNGPVVQVKSNEYNTEVLKDTDHSVIWSGPLVVLVNEFSASASEILAAAIQDYKRGVIIGSKQTYGKGTVQNVIDLNRMVRNSSNGDVGALKYTHSKFYRINGGSTQLEGVKSDVVVPDRYSYIDLGEKDQDNPLPWDKIESVSYNEWYSSGIKEAINNSKMRMSNNDYLSLVDDNAKWFKELREDNLYSLNYEDYKKDYESRDNKSKEFDAIYDYQTDLKFSSLPYEVNLTKVDTLLKAKRVRWHDNLAKDFYVNEALQVLEDLYGFNKANSEIAHE